MMIRKRNVYLDNTPLEKAQKIFFEELMKSKWSCPIASEQIDVTEAVGRVTAEPVFALCSSPHYNASAMDGIAVRTEKTIGAKETAPVRLKKGSDFVYVDTGDPIPEGFDAVIKIEDVEVVDNSTVEIISAASPWQHVRNIGEDVAAFELILPENHRIRPVDIGGLLAGGVTRLRVRKKPKIAIQPTGTELVKPGRRLNPGDIIEYNSYMLKNTAISWGADAEIQPILPDDYHEIKSKVRYMVKNSDVIVINAGSSAGSEDYTSAIVRELGRVVAHGVAIKPGKPVVLGIVEGKPVIGIPGYPVSALLTFNLFVKPIVYKLLGLSLPEADVVEAVLARKVASGLGLEEFLRVKLGYVGNKLTAVPISRGAGVITSMIRADGILRVGRLSEGIDAGEKVKVELLRPLKEIKNNILSVGSHDICLDVLTTLLKQRHPEITLSSAHVGSVGGLIALRRGECHFAGIHLLDPDTGEYNTPYLKRFLPSKKVVLINLVYRQQGLMVKKGNPKGIKGLQDLVKQGVTFVNRQKGAGTRILLEHEMKKLGIKPEEINGFEREEYTHTSVAATVAAGSADTGLGIKAAANAYGLDFIPVAEERYDLAVPEEFLQDDCIQKLLQIVKSPEFKKAVENLGGYSTKHTGKVVGRNEDD